MAFEYLSVPEGDKAVYGLAETYFVERLIAHFRPMGYECSREYEYAGGLAWMPKVPTVSHTNPQMALIFRMLQGGDDAFGFRITKQKLQGGKLKQRGFQKPDFMAFRAHDGVVGEIGTANMKKEKTAQLNGRLRDLRMLTDEESEAETYRSEGRPLRWHGMVWLAAKYHPEEGPVLIPVDSNRLISTLPTFEPKVDGLYLYQLLRYEGHRLPVGKPVSLPRLSPQMVQQLNDAWRRYNADRRGPRRCEGLEAECTPAGMAQHLALAAPGVVAPGNRGRDRGGRGRCRGGRGRGARPGNCRHRGDDRGLRRATGKRAQCRATGQSRLSCGISRWTVQENDDLSMLHACPSEYLRARHPSSIDRVVEAG